MQLPYNFKPYRASLIIASLLFFTSGIFAIVQNEILWLVVPFAWVLLPMVLNYCIQHTEQLFWLLLCFIPLSTEWQVTPALGLDFPDEVLLILLTGIIIVKLLYQPQWFPTSVAKHPLWLVLIIYLFWIIVTCIFSAEPILSVKYLLAKTWYILPFVLLPQKLLNTKSRLQQIAICLTGTMCLIVIQVLIRQAFYGFRFESIGKTMFPFFRNHVNYGAMLVCLLPVAWAGWQLTPKTNRLRPWIMAGLLLGIIALFLSYSRGAWIALPAGLFTVWLITKKWLAPFMIIILLGIGISLAWLVTDHHFMRFIPDHDHTVFHTDFGEHLQATLNGKDVSAAERFYRWVAGVRMMADKPITGFGPNSFYLHYRPYTVPRFQTWVSDNPEHSTVHNYFLLIALEQGAIGLILFCCLFFGMLWHVQKLYHRFQSRYYQTITLVTGCILAMMAVINCMSDMIETDKIGSLFWLSLGMIILLTEKSSEEKIVLA
jgi:O-antigen ligase